MTAIPIQAERVPAGQVGPPQQALILLCVMLLTGAFIQNGFLPISLGLVRVGIAILTLFLIGRHWRSALRVATRDGLLLGLILLACASLFWSIDPALSLQRAIALITATLLGVYIAMQFSIQQQASLFLRAIGLILIFSALFALFLPQYGLMGSPHVGRWNGILSHKNVLGRIAALGAILLIYLPPAYTRLSRPGQLLLFALAVLIIVMTESAAARMILLLFVAALPLSGLLKAHPYLFMAASILGLLIAVALLLWFLGNYEAVFAVFGRDATLTGRSMLWDSSLLTILDRPWLGHGYSASFTPGAPIYARLIWQEAPHAHNGWLDIGLDLGLLGVSLFTLGYLRSVFRAFHRIRWQPGPTWRYCLIFLLLFLAGSITDTSPFLIRDITWIMYVSVTLTLAQPIAEEAQT